MQLMNNFEKLLTEADALIGQAMRAARSPLAQENLKQAQFQIDDASAHEKVARQRPAGIGNWNRKALSRMSRNPNTRAFSSRT